MQKKHLNDFLTVFLSFKLLKLFFLYKVSTWSIQIYICTVPLLEDVISLFTDLRETVKGKCFFS